VNAIGRVRHFIEYGTIGWLRMILRLHETFGLLGESGADGIGRLGATALPKCSIHWSRQRLLDAESFVHYLAILSCRGGRHEFIYARRR
jgi:hypothetical protein